MRNSAQYRRRADEALAVVEGIRDKAAKEDREFTEDERKVMDEKLAEAKQANADAAREDKLIEQRAAAGSVPVPREAATVHDRAEDRPFASLGEFLQCVAAAGWEGRGERFGEFSGGQIDPRLRPLAGPTGVNTGVGSEGAYLVRKDWTTVLLDRAMEEAQVAPDCFEVPIGPDSDGFEAPMIDESSRATGSRWGGVRVYRRSEADTVTASKPGLQKFTIDLEDLMALCYVTERQLRDGMAMQAIIEKAFASEFAFTLDDEIINGGGSGQCLGVLNSPALVTVAKESGQAASTFVAANAAKMFARMPARLIGGATWYINQDVFPQLLTMTLSNMPVYLPGGTIANAPYGLLFGRPIKPIEQAQSLTNVGDVIFANMGEYALATKGGIEQADSMHVRFIYNERAFRWLYRVNGAPAWRTSKTPKNGSNNLSPFIALAAR